MMPNNQRAGGFHPIQANQPFSAQALKDYVDQGGFGEMKTILQNLEEHGVPVHVDDGSMNTNEATRLFLAYMMKEHKDGFTQFIKNEIIKEELKK